MCQKYSLHAKLRQRGVYCSILAAFLAITAAAVTTTFAFSAPPSKTAKISKTSKSRKKAVALASGNWASSAQNRTDFLLRLDQAFTVNALRAEDSYVNRRVTFVTFAGETQRKNGRPLLSTSIQYTNPNTFVAANVSLVPSMTTLAASLERDDRIEVSAILRRRNVRTQSSVQYSGSMNNGSGIVGGGTVTQTWSEYTFVEGTFRVLSRVADERKAEAKRNAKIEQEESQRNEVFRRAVQEFDLPSIRQAFKWDEEGKAIGRDMNYVIHVACMDADPNSPSYSKVREAYRCAISHYSEEGIPEKILKSRLVGLLQDRLDDNAMDKRVDNRALETFYYILKSEHKDKPIALNAQDVEVFRVFVKSLRYQEVVNNFSARVWNDDGWQKNQYLDMLRQFFPKR